MHRGDKVTVSSGGQLRGQEEGWGCGGGRERGCGVAGRREKRLKATMDAKFEGRYKNKPTRWMAGRRAPSRMSCCGFLEVSRQMGMEMSRPGPESAFLICPPTDHPIITCSCEYASALEIQNTTDQPEQRPKALLYFCNIL